MSDQASTITPQQATILTTVAAEVLQVLGSALQEHGQNGILWTDLVTSVGVALKGLMTVAREADPALDEKKSWTMNMVSLARGLNAPDEIIKNVRDGDESGKFRTGIIPLRTH